MSYAKKKHQELMRQVASIILAGGEGKRLYPLTLSRSKPGVCFGGEYRLIDIPISNALNAKIENIFVISQYFSSSLHQHIMETYHLPTKIETLCPKQGVEKAGWFQGTADAVRKNLEHFKKAPVDYFLILSGDQLYNIHFPHMLTFAEEQDVDLVIASIPVKKRDASRMGLLKINKENVILDFCEKPKDPKKYALSKAFMKNRQGTHYLASMGIYIFKKKALFDLLAHKGNDFGKDLIPIQIKKSKAISYVYKGYWEDIGTIASFYQANLALLNQKNCLNTYDENNPIFTHHHHLPSPLIDDTIIHHSIIGQGSIIKAKAITNSVVGLRMKINQGTIIEDSVLLGSWSQQNTPPLEYAIGKNCVLRKIILDEEASIGNGVELTNRRGLQTYDSNGIYIRDGIIIVTTGTKVPDGFIL